jgi:hypothetical protein
VTRIFNVKPLSKVKLEAELAAPDSSQERILIWLRFAKIERQWILDYIPSDHLDISALSFGPFVSRAAEACRRVTSKPPCGTGNEAEAVSGLRWLLAEAYRDAI